MPYVNRETQLQYMRDYMKRKRIVARIARWKQRKQFLLQRFNEEPAMKYYIDREDVGSHCDKEIARLEGLLENDPKRPKLTLSEGLPKK